jgi:lipid-A-disaccharide synthase
LHQRWPEATFFGCAGPRMQAAGVEPVIDAARLAVVGLVEVIAHIPRIYGEYRRLLRVVAERRPHLAVLTDSPDFHLRLARRLHKQRIPVVYLVAPQAWAWRKGRVRSMRQTLQHLLCIFPFEQQFFRDRGVPATYIGHPLAGRVKPALDRAAFFRKHRLPANRPLITVMPGSRRGEAARHLPRLLDALERLYRKQAVSFLLPASPQTGVAFYRERLGRAPVQVIEGESWDAIAHADLVLAASGTVTIEAALLGTPTVTFYKVTALSWLLGKLLVQVPFYSMVNLVAGRAIIPELMQGQMTGERLAREATWLLENESARQNMREALKEVAGKLSGGGDAIGRAASLIQDWMEGQVTYVS